jgi:hypothetical protein
MQKHLFAGDVNADAITATAAQVVFGVAGSRRGGVIAGSIIHIIFTCAKNSSVVQRRISPYPAADSED